jgi:hypothetical protein
MIKNEEKRKSEDVSKRQLTDSFKIPKKIGYKQKIQFLGIDSQLNSALLQ